MNKFRFTLFILSTLILWGCEGTKRFSTKNLSFIYQKDKNTIDANLSVYHIDAVNSELHFAVNSNSLLYAKNPETDHFISKIGISYALFKSYEERTILDSATVWLTDTNDQKISKLIYGKIPIKIAYPQESLILVTLRDGIKKINEQKIVPINKSDFVNPQNFMVSEPLSGLPILTRIFNLGEEIKVEYQYRNIDKVFVDFYQREFDLPPPPFSNKAPKRFDYTPDSSFTLALKDSSNLNFTIKQKGFYTIKTVKSTKEGLTLFCFDENFPAVKTPDDMIEPARYISTNKEYQEMLKNPESKSAVDNFWLSLSSNADEARVLIKNYYHRIEESNRYFSSYIPGWKTDRGMIFTVFGKPNVIYKDDITETWIYGDENTPMSITFYFLKVDNPFSKNDFRLTRSPLFKNPWYGMVDSWRKGKIVDQY